MDPGFARDANQIVQDAIGDLSRPPAPAGEPQHFFVVSRRTKFIVNVDLARSPRVDLEDIFLALCDFLDAQAELEDGNIYLSKLGENSILLEPFGDTVFAEAFSGNADRSRYKDFHRVVRRVQKNHPGLSAWDGKADTLPRGFSEKLKANLVQPPLEPARPHHEHPRPAGPARSVEARRPEPDIQDCERKMRDWYKKGFKIDKLKEALHQDWATLVLAFEVFERDVARLDELRAQLEEMRGLGFDDDVRRIAATLNDPGNVGPAGSQMASLARRVKDKYTIKLPVTDRRQLAEAIRNLPFGIPSSLWGMPLDTLIDKYLAAERGVTPDGSVVVWLRGGWYITDTASADFLGAFSGQVRAQKELWPPDRRIDRIEALIDR